MKHTKRFLIIFGIIIGFMGCELTEEEAENNNPAELVGKWGIDSIQVGMEITTNSNQELIDFTKSGIGNGLSFAGDNISENLKYLNPFLMFFGPDEDDNVNGEDDNPEFFYAAQNLDLTLFQNPTDLIGQTMKIFVLFEDHDHIHNNDGTEIDTTVIRAAYFQWVMNDSSEFFMGDRPPDSLYLADRVNPTDFTLDTTNNKLVLNNMSLYFAEFIFISDIDDSLMWDSSRVVVASGDLMPATFTISANNPTIVTTPFLDEEFFGGPSELDIQDDGKVAITETYYDCDAMGNCGDVTEHYIGDWWTEGPDTLIIIIPEDDGLLDTVELQYVVTATDLNIVLQEDPCEHDDEFYSPQECKEDIMRVLVGLQPNSVTSMDLILKFAFKKSSETSASPLVASKVMIRTIAPRWLGQIP